MTAEPQRYCPSCDRAFLDGEPVLRCPECGVRQHPTCWVTNEGCVTEGHEGVNPLAEPYERGDAAPAPAGPGVGEDDDDGVAVAGAPVIGSSAAGARQRPMNPPREAQDPRQPGERMTAGAPPRSGRAAPPVQQRKRPNPGELGKPAPGMPRVYGQRGILRFWYVPVGILLAVGVAVGVVWGVDQFAGDDDDGAPADVEETVIPTPEATEPGGGVATEPPIEPPAETTPTPGGSGFSAGDTAVVQGTGNCLNIRSEPSLAASVVDCYDDGTQMDLLEGPVPADDLNWWRVQGPASTGWAADLYFAPPASE